MLTNVIRITIFTSMATNKDWKSYLKQLTDKLDEVFGKKAPQLPEGVKDFIVKVAPWLTILGVVFGVIGVLALLGVGALSLPFAAVGAGNLTLGVVVSLVFGIVSLILEAMAIGPLMKRKEKGWTLLYYVVLLNAVSAILSLNFLGLLIGTVIFMYLLFQIRSYYK